VNANPKAAYFDEIADQWDGWEDPGALSLKLDAGLEQLGVGADESVLDVGCGTGNLTRALLSRLSAGGRVVAVDISSRMIDVARAKVPDPRVTWHVADAQRLPLADGSCDRVICCSVWPHFDDREAVAAELGRVMRSGGFLHVWHLIPRARVNEIHASAGEAVRRETARLLGTAGFEVLSAVETSDRYLVTVTRRAP
jgi:ubiquinone/menaquinone biosynthesis C-methylase UbiE